jgi:localization factor PodJL
MTPQGIVLQGSGRQPTAEELANMQAQQNVAVLSSHLGANAARLSPADLMPEEVAKMTRASASQNATDLQAPALRPQRASLSASQTAGAQPGQATAQDWKSASQLSLPPATVGPLSLRLAAANGDPSAAFEVGARLAEGKGTTQDFTEAVVWYQKSASQGFAQAQYRLGTLYERGLGVKKDPARAQMWYQRAAEQGHVKAMHNLAVLSAGRNSGNPDYTTASQWFQSAADYGLADSQFNLAVLHENGFGVAKSPVQAYKWYSLAGQGGDAEAMRRRDALKAQLTADERLQAEKDLAAFHPKRGIPLVNDPRAAGEDWKKRQES